MNRLAVGRSARAQQAHKVDNTIDRLMALHKTDTDTQTTAVSGEQRILAGKVFQLQMRDFCYRGTGGKASVL